MQTITAALSVYYAEFSDANDQWQRHDLAGPQVGSFRHCRSRLGSRRLRQRPERPLAGPVSGSGGGVAEASIRCGSQIFSAMFIKRGSGKPRKTLQ